MMNTPRIKPLHLALVAALAASSTVGCASEPAPPEDSKAVVTLASTRGDNPAAIAVDGGQVYWTEFDTGFVMKVPVDGGEAVIVAQDQDRPDRIAVRDGQVVWGTHHALMMQAANSSTPVVLATESTYFSDIVIDEESIYWGVGSADGEQGQIRRISRQGGAPETLVHDNSPQDISIAGGEIYWTNVLAVGHAPLAGGEARVLYPDADLPLALTVVGDELYWSNRGGLMRGAKGGGLPASIAADRVTLSIENDGESLYWSDFSTGALMKLALGGGAPVLLVPGPTASLFIAVDEAWVYWVDGQEHAVKKVRK